MKRRELLFALGTTAGIALSPLHPGNASVKELAPIELPPDFQYPNGITHAKDGTLYVGSITSGRILKISPQGRIETFFPGSRDIFAVTALRIDEIRGILWGASPDVLGTPQANGEVVRRQHRIFAIDLRANKVLKIFLMPDGGFGNDLALDPQGGIYITDTSRPRIHYISPGADRLQIWLEDEQFRTQLRFGLSGITRRADGVLFLTMYSDGKRFQITPRAEKNHIIQEIELPRRIDGSDAIALTADGSLLMIEGGIESGNGRLLQLSGLDANAKPQFKTLASGMNLPVNLTAVANEIWLTESLFRHRLIPGKEKEIPNRFFIRQFKLPSGTPCKGSIPFSKQF